MKKTIKKMLPFGLKCFIADCLYKVFRFRISNKTPTVLSFEQTINYIKKDKLSVSRFGDGEFKWMFQKRENGNFERNSPELSRALKRTLKNNSNNLLLCIPDVFSGLSQYNKEAKEYWALCLGISGVTWINELNKGTVYGDTQFTRPYMDCEDKSQSEEKFRLLKSLWENREIVIVEGDKSRFGVGNDLLWNAKSVKRILAPAVNAFEKYREIKEKVIQNAQVDNVLVLISLGPTATVLAADLAEKAIQAIDIGHLDIEYSWYLSGATKKIPVTGKYVNEVPEGGHEVEKLSDQQLHAQYQSEIIGKIN